MNISCWRIFVLLLLSVTIAGLNYTIFFAQSCHFLSSSVNSCWIAKFITTELSTFAQGVESCNLQKNTLNCTKLAILWGFKRGFRCRVSQFSAIVSTVLKEQIALRVFLKRMDRYRKMRIIGAGSFGTAWLVESNFSGKKYALKELCVSTMSEQDRHLSLNEAKILSRLKHKNVVRYREAFVQDNKLYIAMEYAEQGQFGLSTFQLFAFLCEDCTTNSASGAPGAGYGRCCGFL